MSAALPAHAAASRTDRVTLTSSRAAAYPDETATVRVTSIDADGRPRAGDAVSLSLDDPARAIIERPTGVTDSSGAYTTSVRVRTDAAPGSLGITASTSSGATSTALEVREATVIRHDETGASTRVLALAHGYQDDIATVENRGFAHSDLQPTGRHVRAKQVLQVEVPDGAPATLSLAIGARGPWKAFNGGTGTDLSVTTLTTGSQSITAAQDGIVYVINHSDSQAVELTVSGGSAQPVWVKDRTTSAEFASRLAASSVPVVTLVGDRVFVDVQRRVIDDMAARNVAWDPADTVARLDRVLSSTCDVYGLSYAAVGVGRKHAGRVYFSGADSGAGWAFATSQWLCFQVDTGASEALLADSDSWGIWHEVGHTFQTPSYTWSGLGEVTVNISSLALQQRHTGHHRLDEWPEAEDRIARYFAQAVGDRSFAQLTDEDPFYPLFLFDQLRQSFGEGFYPAVDQAYRVRRIRGLSMPSSDQDKKDLFAQVASQVAERDLGPFFTAWGVPITSAVLTTLSAHPALQNQIWTAIDSRDAHRERDAGYDLPIGTLTAENVSLYLGDRTASSGEVTGLSTLAGSTSTLVARESVAINVGSMEGRLLAILQSSDATREALTRTVPVTVTSALGFVGIYDVRSGWIGMSRDGKRLVVTSTGVAPHDYYFTGKLYYQVALQNARGRTLVTVTVNGDDTHDKVVTALDGMSVSNGYRLLVTAAEPSRVRVYADSVQTGSLSMTPQTLTIRGGRFVV
ncbi:M60 family metallopeptidase [Microbacterium sp. NPDC089190]|uniref:M60 family metallopeptidase n=1 Tax=Microbacterium sp. NPDC089190 TaxID=3155063 RepID=UPI00344BA825